MTLGYFCAVGLAVVFMLYMDGEIGVMMLAFLLLMPVLSLLVTLWVRRGLSISLELPDSTGKHQPITAKLHLEKQSRLPLPFLRLYFSADEHFYPLNTAGEPLSKKPDPSQMTPGEYRRAYKSWKQMRRLHLTPDSLPLCLSAGTALTADYTIPLRPRFCGKGTVSLHDAVLSDFLGMFRFRIPKGPDTNQIEGALGLTSPGRLLDSRSVLILPEIPEIKANSALYRSVANAVQTADEETESTPNFSASAAPGYEHRGYIPGDPLKRINWKLSSKRHQLMVRQDEPVALARLSVVLDFRSDDRSISEKARLMEEEQLIETALGFLMLCAQFGYPCRLSYITDLFEWNSLSIDDGVQLETESLTLLAGGFRHIDLLSRFPLLPPEVMQDSGILLLYFTTVPDGETVSALNALSVPCELITPQLEAQIAVKPDAGGLWLVGPGHELTAVRSEG